MTHQRRILITSALPYINGGQFRRLAAHRTNIEGLRQTIIPVFWGVSKR